MRKLKPYNKCSFEFYKEIVDSKRNSTNDPDYKARLEAQQEVVEKCFKIYEEGFANDDLISLVNYGFANGDKSDLLRLYSYNNQKIQDLKRVVTTTEYNRLMNTCQNCTIGEVNSFDHFVSKDEFPEFAVQPKNLFPSCSKCNSYKGQRWRENGQITHLNLYLDELPEEQYLFVAVEIIDNDVVTTEFYLDNPNGIDPVLYNRIQNHYRNLHLCRRFRENADSVITNLEDSLRNCIRLLSLDEIIDLVNENCRDKKKKFGYNYWKAILEVALVANKDFIEMIVNSL